MKTYISKNIRGSIPKCDKAKNFMKAVEEQFVSSNKARASALMNKLLGMKHNNSTNASERIMDMRDFVAQLKSLEIEFLSYCRFI